MSETKKPWKGVRRGDGGKYLIIADESDEFAIAAHYAARIVHARRAHIAIAHITDIEGFVQWGNIESMMRHDLRQQAEKTIWQAAKMIHEDHNLFCEFQIHEGQVEDKIIEMVENNKDIRALILAASTHNNNPGRLVTYFSNKGIARLKIPVIIIPGHLDKEAINAIT